MDIASCNGDPEFWNNMASDGEEEAIVRDLTIPYGLLDVLHSKFSLTMLFRQPRRRRWQISHQLKRP